MKNFYLLSMFLLALMFSNELSSQQLSCGQDTLRYSLAKGDLVDGQLSGVGLSGPFTGAGQIYEVPAGAMVEVTGFTVYGSTMAADALVACSIFEADDLTGLPAGDALATVEVTLTETEELVHVNFATPVTVTGNFVLTTEKLDDVLVLMTSNDGMLAAGQGEQLALLLFQGNWVVAETAGPPGAFNFDFLMEPFVNYDITAGMTSDVVGNTITADSDYTFTTDHSPLVNSKFFNTIAFDAFFSAGTVSATDWNFGDGSVVVNGDEALHSFTADETSYTVSSTVTMVGFTTVCSDVTEVTLNVFSPVVYTCGQDTLRYSVAKGDLVDGQLSGVGLSGPFTGAGQIYEVPTGATVEVTGFTVYGSTMGADALVACSIFEADELTGLPAGDALATVEVTLTETEELVHVNFATPVTVTGNFVLTTEKLDDVLVLMTSNDGMLAAGQGEQLALLLFQGNWVVAETAGPPGAFNFDFLMEPFVNYDITAGMTSDVVGNTITADSDYTFTTDHSPLVNSKFFNTIAFDAFFSAGTVSATDWNFGDGSVVVNGDEALHSFTADETSYTVSSTVTMVGFTTLCTDVVETTYDVDIIDSINENSLANLISIFPNPTNGFSQIHLELNKPSDVHVLVLNTVGQQVVNFQLNQVSSEVLDLNLSNKEAGMYFIQIEIDGKSTSKKLILQ